MGDGGPDWGWGSCLPVRRRRGRVRLLLDVLPRPCAGGGGGNNVHYGPQQETDRRGETAVRGCLRRQEIRRSGDPQRDGYASGERACLRPQAVHLRALL